MVRVATHNIEEPPRNKSFHDFLRLLHAVLSLEPLFSIFAWFLHQGYLLGCSLAQWVEVRITKQAPAHRNKRVKSSDLKCGRFLGEGCSGIIYEATWSRGRNISLLARKAFPAVPADVFEYEATRLVELAHPNIVKVLGWTVDRRSCSLVMDHMKYDLFSVIQKRKEAMRYGAQGKLRSTFPIPLREAVHIMLQIAEGMEYVHDQGLAHGDLKPNNVLVDSESGLMLVKIVDFGLTETKKRSTTLVSNQAQCLQILKWKAPELFEDLLDSSTEDSENMWTEMFPDLEVVKTSHASSSVTMGSAESKMQLADVYSFALTCSYILGAQVPHDSNLGLFELRNEISYGARPQLPFECPRMLASLIRESWHPIPSLRPHFMDICSEMHDIERALEQSEDEYQYQLEHFEKLKAKWGHFFFDFNESGLEVEGRMTGRHHDHLTFQGEGKWKTDDGEFHSVVIKTFRIHEIARTEPLLRFFDSEGTEADLRTSRVLRPLGGTLLKDGRLALVYESCWGDLLKLILFQKGNNKNTWMPPFKLEMAIDIMLQIAEGMVELHEFGIVHGDVKSRNVLVHDLERFSTGGNHGLISCALTGYENSEGDWGTGFWRAPEILDGENMGTLATMKFTPPMDVYSYGFTCYEILTGNIPLPFQHPRRYEILLRGRRPELPVSVHPHLRHLVESCWDANPLKRPTSQGIVLLLKNIAAGRK